MPKKTKATGDHQSPLQNACYENNHKTSYESNQGGEVICTSMPTILTNLSTTSQKPHITIGKSEKDVKEVIEAKVVIDKVELICNLSSQHFSMILNEFSLTPECYKGRYKKITKYNKNGSKYYAHQCVMPLHGNSKLIMIAGKTKDSFYLKFILNPSKMSDESWVELHEYMATIFEYGYHSLYAIARVSYIEFAADLKGVDFNDIFVLDNRVTKYKDSFLNIGTLYLGVRKGLRQIAVYDKRKQLSKSGVNHLDALTRIEVRLCPKNLPLSELTSIKNPFASITVSPQSSLEALTGTKGGEGLIKMAYSLRGWLNSKSKLLMAYFMLMSPYRSKQIAETVAKHQYQWWAPELIWAKALEAIAVLNPPPYVY